VIVFVVATAVVLALFALYLVKARTPEQADSGRPTREEQATIASTTPNDAGAESMASPAPGEIGPSPGEGSRQRR
jgi:hypothetical protein